MTATIATTMMVVIWPPRHARDRAPLPRRPPARRGPQPASRRSGPLLRRPPRVGRAEHVNRVIDPDLVFVADLAEHLDPGQQPGRHFFQRLLRVPWPGDQEPDARPLRAEDLESAQHDDETFSR